MRQRRRASPVTLESIVARYVVCCSLLQHAFESLLEEVGEEQKSIEIIEGQQIERTDLFSFIWHDCQDQLLEIRRAQAIFGRISSHGAEPAKPRWVVMPYRCTKCSQPYELPLGVADQVQQESKQFEEAFPAGYALALQELCPDCCAEETGIELALHFLKSAEPNQDETDPEA